MSLPNQAQKITLNSLRKCYRDYGIIAGPHHFTDYWARDGFFAAFGALSVGDDQIVRQMLKLFFTHQRRDGLIPYRLMRGPVTLGKYLGFPKYYSQPRPTYRLRGLGPEVLDGTTLTLLFTALLQEKSFLPQIKLALQYLITREKHGLLWDGPMAEWNDIIWKWGNLLYSNIIYWYMYDRLASWTNSFDPTWSRTLIRKRDSLAHSLRSRLWNGHYFADWHDHRRQDYFYPFGNCLAIAWGLTAPAESDSILAHCQKSSTQFTLPTNTPNYPWWRVDFLQRLTMMGDYQNNHVLWWQPIATYLAALKHQNKTRQVKSVTTQITTKILYDQTIYECFEPNGKPLKRFFYQAEQPFAWASGLILWSLAYNTQHDKI